MVWTKWILLLIEIHKEVLQSRKLKILDTVTIRLHLENLHQLVLCIWTGHVVGLSVSCRHRISLLLGFSLIVFFLISLHRHLAISLFICWCHCMIIFCNAQSVKSCIPVPCHKFYIQEMKLDSSTSLILALSWWLMILSGEWDLWCHKKVWVWLSHCLHTFWHMVVYIW